MPLAATAADPKAMPDFLRLVGADLWATRLADLGRRAQASAFQGRATQHRHALEFALARAARGTAQSMNLRVLPISDAWASRQMLLCTRTAVASDTPLGALLGHLQRCAAQAAAEAVAA